MQPALWASRQLPPSSVSRCVSRSRCPRTRYDRRSDRRDLGSHFPTRLAALVAGVPLQPAVVKLRVALLSLRKSKGGGILSRAARTRGLGCERDARSNVLCAERPAWNFEVSLRAAPPVSKEDCRLQISCHGRLGEKRVSDPRGGYASAPITSLIAACSN